MNHRSRVIALSIAVAVLSACSIPSRDNPNDPSNRPDATLTITPDDGSPHTQFTFTVTSPASVTSLLDLDGDGVFETTMPGGTYIGEIPLAAGVFGSAGVGSIVRTVRARVRSDGGSADVSADVRVHNAAPALDLGPDVVASAWEAPTVHLDACGDVAGCAAPDPDGPAGLTYSWKQLFGTPVISGVVQSSALSFTAPLAPQTMVFDLTVDDGFAKATAPVSVRVGHPAWVSSVAPSGVERLFPDARRIENPTVQPPIAVTADPDGEIWMIGGDYVGTTDWEVDRLASDGSVLGRWPLGGAGNNPFGGGGPVIGDGNLGGWTVLGVGGATYQVELRHLAPIASGTAGSPSVTVTLPFSPGRVLADPASQGGVIVLGGGQGVRVAADLTVSAPFNFPAGDRATFANDGTIWSAFSTGGTTIQVHHLGAGDVDEQIDFPGNQLIGLVPGSEGVLVLIGDGVSLDRIQPVVDPLAPALPEIPAPAVSNFNGSTVAANGDGDVYILGYLEATLRRLHPTDAGFEIAMSATLTDLGIPIAGSSSPPPQLTGDVWNGGVLVTGGSLPGDALLVRVPRSGLPFETALSSLPLYVNAESGRGSYWAEAVANGVGHLRRFDTRGKVLADFAIPSDESSFDVLTVTADGGAETATLINSSADTRIRRIDRKGVQVGSPQDFVGQHALSYGIDATGAVTCDATIDGFNAANGEHLRRLTAGGAQIEFASGPFVGNGPFVVSSRSGVCWGRLGSSTDVEYSDATTSQSFPMANGLDTILPDPYDDSAWVVDGSGQEVLHLAAKTGSILGQFALPVPIARSGSEGLYPITITRACDATAESGRPECRELWISDYPANPGTIYRVDGSGSVLATYPMKQGAVGWLDVR